MTVTKLSDVEVFGPPVSEAVKLSDEEVFGIREEKQVVTLTDEEVFGSSPSVVEETIPEVKEPETPSEPQQEEAVIEPAPVVVVEEKTPVQLLETELGKRLEVIETTLVKVASVTKTPVRYEFIVERNEDGSIAKIIAEPKGN